MPKAKFGTFDDLLQISEEAVRPIAIALREWVNLGFYQGVDLADPKELLEGTGARMRHVKIRSIDGAKRPEVGALIKAARTRRRET